MATHTTLVSLFNDIASAIRQKTGAQATIIADNFPQAIQNIPTGQARSSADLTTNDDTVIVPAGLYSVQASKAVGHGSEGTPTAAKGSVSNHSVSITPFVTNTKGYISGGTHTGTSISVSASELVSGSETKTANGTYNVTNLAQIVVAIPTYNGGIR